MILLALSTSGRAASAALLKDGCLLAEATRDEGLTHSETSLPLTAELLEQNGLAPADVDVFAADIGPGSFTGVRIGVCAINAMAAACGKPVVAVSSLAALREGLPEENGPVCALLDARNGNAYAARYRDGRCVEAPRAVELAAYGAGLDGARCIGDVPALCAPLELPSAANVGLAAFTLLDGAGAQANPLYLRPSQAERMAGEGRR
mgnify:CR=1 FL=1